MTVKNIGTEAVTAAWNPWGVIAGPNGFSSGFAGWPLTEWLEPGKTRTFTRCGWATLPQTGTCTFQIWPSGLVPGEPVANQANDSSSFVL